MAENQITEDVVGASEPVQDEKMLPQSQVNKIVWAAKEEARKTAETKAETNYAGRLEELHAQRQLMEQGEIAKAQESANTEVPRDVNADAVYQQVQERFNKEMQQRQVEQEMTQVAQNYTTKMKQGAENYDDFDEITKDFDPTSFPQLLYLVAGIDNAADVVYELSKNPSKLATLDYLAERSPKQAHAELIKLAASIADNRRAQTDAQNQNVNAPLDRLQPSRISGSNGKQSIKDLRNQPWLRG